MVRIGSSGESPEVNKKQLKKASSQEAQNSSVFNNSKTHTVANGENFFKIAKKHGLTVYELAEANGWKYDKNTQTVRANGKIVELKKGQRINVSKPATNKPEATPKAETTEKAITQHTVKSGDSPFAIADKYQISIRQLAAANGWEVKHQTKGNKEYLAVFKNDKEVVLNKGEKLEIPNSVTKNIGTIKNLTELKNKSGMSDEQLEIFRKFEGKPENDYKPYTTAERDGKGTWTIGYGYTKNVVKGQKWSTEQCYQQLAKDFLQTQEDIRLALGDEAFNKMPRSLREGIIDLVFNKGFDAIDIDKFQKAVLKEDYKTATKQLIYTKSMVDDKEMNGLYKRSLARIAHVYNGLPLEDKFETKFVVDSLYKASENKVSKTELQKWWKPEIAVQGAEEQKNAQDSASSAKYVVQKGDSSISSIARKLGINAEHLMILNKHLAPEYKIKVGDSININSKISVENTKPLPKDLKLSEEIVRIKEMDLDSQERLTKTNELIDSYAKEFKLSENAINLLKTEAKKEYESWFWVDTDKMTAMTDILDATDAQSLAKAIDGAIDESEEAKKFASEVLNKKINKDNIPELIALSGGSKKFIKMMKKVGGFDILKHSLTCLTADSKSQQELLTQYNKAVKEDDYSEVQRVFDNVLAQSPKEISNALNNTLVDDDDLNAILYKYQIKQVNSDNIIEVLKTNDIIAGICEADNERSVCKAEIQKLFETLDKNYDLDDNARANFLEVFETEFRDRSVWNPSTWWIGTKKVSAAFNKLLDGDLQPRNMRKAIANSLGWTEADMNPKSKTDGKVEPIFENFEPTGSGVLDGRKILINSGHGGYNPNTKQFDVGAEGIKGLGVTEWMMNRFMAQKVMDKLRAQGATIVFTTGHFETVSYKGYEADLHVSLHSDSRKQGSSMGPKIIAHPKDPEDEKLGLNILQNYIESDGITNLKKRDFAKKDGTWYLFDKQFSPEDSTTMQANVIYGSKQVLRKSDKKSLDEPAVLVEFCDINNEKDLRNIVLGKYGDEIADAIVKGIIDYWE